MLGGMYNVHKVIKRSRMTRASAASREVANCELEGEEANLRTGDISLNNHSHSSQMGRVGAVPAKNILNM